MFLSPRDTNIPEDSYCTPCKRTRLFRQFCWGHSFSQGPRRKNEDVVACHPTLCPNISLFGVFDGHMGMKASSFSSESIPSFVAKDPRRLFDMPSCLHHAFIQTDREFLKLARRKSFIDGSTACVLVLHEDQIICANAGDSRCVMCSGGEAVDLSFDHKPSGLEERRRIIRGGAKVEFERINGEVSHTHTAHNTSHITHGYHMIHCDEWTNNGGL
jgi:serine/threonine protein phosphatase PrpC